jgi:uncharacterized membrane protein YozB (DUF420 family)
LDPKLVYWTLALADLGAVAGCLLAGVRRIRRRDIRGHRRRMLAASALVGLFLSSYGVKLILLGREDRGQWTALDRAVLYTHELCVATVLVAGAVAGICAWRFRAQLGAGAPHPSGPPTRRIRRVHRRAGRAAVVGCLLAFVTAMLVLAGMYARAGA